MGKYQVTAPGSANDFVYNGETYKGGQGLDTDNPCEAIAFYNAIKATNPDAGRSNGTPRFWQETEAACNNQGGGVNAAPPSQGNQGPVNNNPPPAGGDNAQQQGAPEVPNNTNGQDTTTPNQPDNPSPDQEPTRPPDGQQHPTLSDEQAQQQTDAGDPVDIFNGALYFRETDLEIPNTIIPLAFTRFYRSGVAAFGPLGWNWDHNFNIYVRELNNGNIAMWRNLHEDIFVFNGVDFESPRGIFKKMSRTPGFAQEFEVVGTGGMTMKFERPGGWLDIERIPIKWMRDRHGNQLTYTYGEEDKLKEVTDDDGRFFRFTYDHCGLLISVEDHAGRKFTYVHDEATFHLVGILSPATTDHIKGIERMYYYENAFAFPELRHNILRVEDGDGRVYLENTYDQDPASWSYARVTEQLYGGYLFQYRYEQLQWVPANPLYINIPAVRVEVMNPDFGLETYTFNHRGDLIDHRMRLIKDKSFRVVIWQYEYDEQGNLTIITKPDGSSEINLFDSANLDPRMRGNLLRKELTAALGFPAPSRIIWKGKYEPNFQLMTEEENEKNEVTKYRYDFNITPAAASNSGKLKEIEYPNTTLPDGSIQNCLVLFEHNARGQITANINPDGSRRNLVYGNAGDSKSRLIKIIDDLGGLNIENLFTYNNFGYLEDQLDGNGHITKSVFNALGQLEKKIEPSINGVEAKTILHYSADRKLISTEKPKGSYSGIADSHIVDKIERDVLGYPTYFKMSENTPESRSFGICNDYRGNPVEIHNPDESVLQRIIDERGLLVNEAQLGKDGKTVFSKNVYNTTGRLTHQINTGGLTTSYSYDGFGRITKITLPNGSEITNIWGDMDLLLSEQIVGDDGHGVVRLLSKTRYQYDEKDRKIKEIRCSFENDPAGLIELEIQFFYDQMDRLIKIKDFRGAEKTSIYDNAGRLIREIDPEGNEEHYNYDNNGNLLQIDSHHKEPSGVTSILTKQFAYDSRNRRIQSFEPDGAVYSEQLDDRNLLVQRTNQLGITNQIQYNSFGEKIREIIDTGGLAITHEWTLDTMGHVLVYRDPSGQLSNYNFDSLGRLEKIDFPNGFSSQRRYNNYGLIVKEELGSGVIFEYSFDTANRLKTIKNPVSPTPILSIPLHQFAYDGLNRVVFAERGTDKVLRVHDSLSRLVSETMNGHFIRCRYNDLGGFVDKIWSDGRTERYAHNLNGVVTNITQTSAGSLGSGNGKIVDFLPSGPNSIGKASYRNTFGIETAYDERKRLVEINIMNGTSTNENLKYRYDTGNRRRVEAIIGNNSKINLYDYDNKNRLLNSKHGLTTSIPNALNQAEHDTSIGIAQANSGTAGFVESFTYNNSDERLKCTETGTPDRNYSYTSGHRIQSDGTNAHFFHADGTLSSDGTLSYEVDSMGRIVSIKQGVNSLMKIEYDAFGRPSILEEDGKPKRSLNYLGSFIEQENHNNIPFRQFTLQPSTGVPLAYHSSGTLHYTLFDGRQNLIALADDNGNLLENYRYDSYGLPTILDPTGSTLTISAFDVEPVFGGQRYYDSVGLYLSTRRLMNPVNGIYASVDPMGYIDSSSLYVYAGQNPIDNIDPHGEIIPFIVAAFVIGGALAGAGYSAYDAYHHPDRYEGWRGSLRVLGNVFGGAAIGGVSILAGEAILAAGGTGIFAAGTGTAATSLTATQTFVLYGTSSAFSGSILRGGFNNMFPEYVNPVTPGTVATDYAAGGGLGVVFRGLSGTINSAPRPNAASPTPQSWLRFWNDAGGSAPTTGSLGPYPGKIGAFLDKFGIRQGYGSNIINNDIAGSWFARTDTAFHEGFHAFVARYFPTFRDLSRIDRLGAIARYPEEVVAYAFGHGAAGRVHGIPLAPVEAFASLSGYPVSQQIAAKIFWGTAWLAGLGGLTYNVANAQEPQSSNYPSQDSSVSANNGKK